MQKELSELEQELNTSLSQGLNEAQFAENQKKYGKNELESKKKQSLFVKFLLQFKDALIIILLIAAIVSVIVDPSEYIDSIIILVVVIANAILGVNQEARAEKSLEALKKMSSPTSKVIRNGSVHTIPSSEVVPGDILFVEAGDYIAADARIIESTSLQIDESALTGESVPVQKNNILITEENVPLGNMFNMVFSCTFVTNGKAKCLVTETGMNTEIGKIAHMLNKTDATKTPLQHKLATVGKVIGIMALIICVVVFGLELLSGLKVIDAFKTAIALAVAAIPEGLATVVTIVLAIGVNKMSKKNAIIKKLPAVETLGATNVICSDKTGTLTQNKMTVTTLFNKEYKDFAKLNKEDKDVLRYFAICSDASINNNDGHIERIGDPTELALLDINNLHGADISKDQRLLDLPFDSDRKLMTTVIKVGKKYLAITKGAPDVIFSRSTNKEDVEEAIKANQDMADNALRVLALATKEFKSLPRAEDLEQEMHYEALVGMIDPERVEVKDSIMLATKAGVRTVMITGDHIVTAKAIAKKLGILRENDLAITSEELSKLSDEYLDEHIEEYSVYARVAPADKVRIVTAWQKRGAIVAMTGDGVNDAPSLKKADIGCAMGITGTDVSKQAADMILTDDNFSTIVSAVKQGRGIYQNIQKCVKYLLSSNIGEVITIFLASLISAIGFNEIGVPLLPIHLLWINLITDSLPSFGIGMEEIDDDVMSEKPRAKNEGFFAHGLGFKIAFEGIVIGLITLTAYLLGVFVFKSHPVAQTMAFLTLSTTQLVHSYNVKSEHSIFSKHTFKNRFINFAFIFGFAMQLIVIYTPLNTIFKFEALDWLPLLTSLGLSLVLTVIMEISKLIRRIKSKKQAK